MLQVRDSRWHRRDSLIWRREAEAEVAAWAAEVAAAMMEAIVEDRCDVGRGVFEESGCRMLMNSEGKQRIRFGEPRPGRTLLR